MKAYCTIGLLALSLAFVTPCTLHAESQEDEYLGITDPFGDPAQYEFSEDEKADKEFFHLGRFLMFGFDIGAGIYTQGLGESTAPALYFGIKLLYFFDRQIAFEIAGHFTTTIDTIRSTATIASEVGTDLIPITGGFRYYFDTKSAPKAIALANPYLAFGGGVYIRSQTPLDNNLQIVAGENSSFGFYAGGGIEFPIYRRHLYLGVDLRYHFIFFFDEDDTLNNNVPEGSRAGDFFTPVVTLTYSF